MAIILNLVPIVVGTRTASLDNRMFSIRYFYYIIDTLASTPLFILV